MMRLVAMGNMPNKNWHHNSTLKENIVGATCAMIHIVFGWGD